MIRSFFEFQKEDKDDHYNKILLERSKGRKESVYVFIKKKNFL